MTQDTINLTVLLLSYFIVFVVGSVWGWGFTIKQQRKNKARKLIEGLQAELDEMVKGGEPSTWKNGTNTPALTTSQVAELIQKRILESLNLPLSMLNREPEVFEQLHMNEPPFPIKNENKHPTGINLPDYDAFIIDWFIKTLRDWYRRQGVRTTLNGMYLGFEDITYIEKEARKLAKTYREVELYRDITQAEQEIRKRGLKYKANSPIGTGTLKPSIKIQTKLERRRKPSTKGGYQPDKAMKPNNPPTGELEDPSSDGEPSTWAER